MRWTWNSFKLCQGDIWMTWIHMWHGFHEDTWITWVVCPVTTNTAKVMLERKHLLEGVSPSWQPLCFPLVREGNSAKLLSCLVACSETQWDRCMRWNPPRLQARAKLDLLTCFFFLHLFPISSTLCLINPRLSRVHHAPIDASLGHCDILWHIVTCCDMLWLHMTIAPAMTCHRSLRPPRPYHRELATCAAALSLKARPRRRKGQSYPSCFRVRFMRLL